MLEEGISAQATEIENVAANGGLWTYDPASCVYRQL